jgi:hypothetical protein
MLDSKEQGINRLACQRFNIGTQASLADVAYSSPDLLIRQAEPSFRVEA